MSDGFLFRSALKDLLRPKKMFAALALALAPCLIALAMRALSSTGQFRPDGAYNLLSEQLIFGFLLVILACVFATSAVSQEIEQKTVVYLLTRPVPRWRILLMKFAATFVVTVVTVWLASLLLALSTYGVSGWGASHLGRDLLIAPIACLAYGALFLLLATLFDRPLIVGLLYAFGIETWVPTLPGNFKMVSLLSYVHVLAPHTAAPVENADSADIAASLLAPPPVVGNLTPHLAWIVIIGVTIVSVLGACFVFANREYVPREDV